MRGPDLVHQIVDLALGRFDHDLRIDQTRRADHLLDELATGAAQFVRPGRRRHIDRLADALGELLPGERAVVHRGGQPEAVFDQIALARHIALVHAADLRDGHMRLVDDQQEILGEVVQQRRRRGSGRAAVDMTRVVLDAGAEADLADHLQVVLGAHAQPLRLEQFALPIQIGQPLLEFGLDIGDGPLHPLGPGHVVRGRERFAANRPDAPHRR